MSDHQVTHIVSVHVNNGKGRSEPEVVIIYVSLDCGHKTGWLVPGVFLLRAQGYICQILDKIETLTIKFELIIFQNINTASDSGG